MNEFTLPCNGSEGGFLKFLNPTLFTFMLGSSLLLLLHRRHLHQQRIGALVQMCAQFKHNADALIKNIAP